MVSIVDRWGLRPGQEFEGELRIGSDPLTPLAIPFWVVVGADHGPTLSIIAGVHGSEYAGIRAAARVFKHLRPEHVRGTIAIVPLANPVAFSRRVAHVCPLDSMNLHKTFPGKAEGSITERLAATIFDEIVMRSDYVIDLHGGDLFESMLAHSLYFVSGNERTDAVSRDMALHFTDRFLYPVMPAERPAGGNLSVEAAKRGIPSIWSEAGSGGEVNNLQAETDLQYQTRGVINVLRRLALLSDAAAVSADSHFELSDQVFVRAEHGGFFLPSVAVGDALATGQFIGEIRDLHDATVEQVSCPYGPAIMRLLHTYGVVGTGDVVAHLCRTNELAK